MEEDLELAAAAYQDALFAGLIAQRFEQLGGDAYTRLKVARAAREAFEVVRNCGRDPLAALLDWLEVEDMEKEMAK